MATRKLKVLVPIGFFYVHFVGTLLLGQHDKTSREAYELYSAAFRGHTACSALGPNEVLAIDRSAVEAPEWMVNELKPRSDEERTMVNGLKRLTSSSFEWMAQFDFGRPYRLLKEDESQVARRCMYRDEFAQSQCKPYIGMDWVRDFSLPSFNKDHTRALIYIRFGRENWGGGAEIAEYRLTKAGWKYQERGFTREACMRF